MEDEIRYALGVLEDFHRKRSDYEMKRLISLSFAGLCAVFAVLSLAYSVAVAENMYTPIFWSAFPFSFFVSISSLIYYGKVTQRERDYDFAIERLGREVRRAMHEADGDLDRLTEEVYSTRLNRVHNLLSSNQ